MPNARPGLLRVALTGGIGTGKSYVRARMALSGVPTIDADAMVHELLGPGTRVSGAVMEAFGPSLVTPDGAIDRQALGRVVFADPAARATLEAIVHPAVYERIGDWLASESAAGSPLAVADIPLLFETGREGRFDRVVVAACDPLLQLQRVMDRDALPESAARARIAAQWPIGRKIERADFVIWTDGTFAETDRQVQEVLARLRTLAGSRAGA